MTSIHKFSINFYIHFKSEEEKATLQAYSHAEMEKLKLKLSVLESENMEHIRRLKNVHHESVEMMKHEFSSQLARVKVGNLIIQTL